MLRSPYLAHSLSVILTIGFAIAVPRLQGPQRWPDSVYDVSMTFHVTTVLGAAEAQRKVALVWKALRDYPVGNRAPFESEEIFTLSADLVQIEASFNSNNTQEFIKNADTLTQDWDRFVAVDSALMRDHVI